MSSAGKVPADLRYSTTHEWVREEGGRVTVGITDHAQAELTDVVFVELPPVGKVVAAHGPLLLLESVKTVADVYAPVAGKVVEVNTELKAHPERVNHDPYGQGWLVKLEPSGPMADLLDAPAYTAHATSKK